MKKENIIKYMKIIGAIIVCIASYFVADKFIEFTSTLDKVTLKSALAIILTALGIIKIYKN